MAQPLFDGDAFWRDIEARRRGVRNRNIAFVIVFLTVICGCSYKYMYDERTKHNEIKLSTEMEIKHQELIKSYEYIQSRLREAKELAATECDAIPSQPDICRTSVCKEYQQHKPK